MLTEESWFPVVLSLLLLTRMLKLGYPTCSLTALHEPIFNPVKSVFFTDCGSFAMFIKQTFVSFWKKAAEDFIWFCLCDVSDNSINNNVKVVSVAVGILAAERVLSLIDSELPFSRRFLPPAACFAALLPLNSHLGALMPHLAGVFFWFRFLNLINSNKLFDLSWSSYMTITKLLVKTLQVLELVM